MVAVALHGLRQPGGEFGLRLNRVWGAEEPQRFVIATTIDVKITPNVPITSLSAAPTARATTTPITKLQKAAATAHRGRTGGGRSSERSSGAACAAGIGVYWFAERIPL